MTTHETGDEVGTTQASAPKRLPFEVRIASSPSDIDELVSLRSETYRRHKAPGAHFLRTAEIQDTSAGAVLLIARAKVDGGVVGSLRIQTRMSDPLLVESAMTLPSSVACGVPVELMRGSVRGGSAGRMVSSALAKASFLMARELGFTHIIVTCREPVDSMYRSYRFDDLLSGRMIDLPYSPGVPHRILCLSVSDAAKRWKMTNASLYEFMIGTTHPDIRLDFDWARNWLQSPTEATESAVA